MSATRPRDDAPTNPTQRLARRLDEAPRARFVALVGLPLLVVYLATASWDRPFSPDTQLNNLTAHAIAKDRTVFLDHLSDAREIPTNMWIVEAEDGRLTSQYTPGSALHAVPFAWFSGDIVVVQDPAPEPWATEVGYGSPTVPVKLPPAWPGALAAVLTTTAAMVLLGLTVRTFAPGHVAASAAWVAGFATSAWSVGADELWQHSPGMMWVGATGFLLASKRPGWSAVTAVVTIVIRPVAAAMWAVAALYAALRRRWSLVALGGAAVVIGLGIVVAYNAAVFGTPSISGGYGPDRGQALLTRSPFWYVANYAKGLFAPSYGVLFWSPWLVVLLAGIPQTWKQAPDWMRSLALGGVAYVFAQWTLNRASGGAAYSFYRYPLEGLVACGPLLALLYLESVQPSPVRRRWFWRLVVLSAAVHGAMALTS